MCRAGIRDWIYTAQLTRSKSLYWTGHYGPNPFSKPVKMDWRVRRCGMPPGVKLNALKMKIMILKRRWLKPTWTWCVIKKRLACKRRRYQRMTRQQKMDAIRLIESSPLSTSQALVRLDLPRSTYYRWKQAFNNRDRSTAKDKFLKT